MRTRLLVSLLAVFPIACSTPPLLPSNEPSSDATRDTTERSAGAIDLASALPWSDAFAVREADVQPIVELGDREIGRADAETIALLRSGPTLVWGSSPLVVMHEDGEGDEADPTDDVDTFVLAADGSVRAQVPYAVIAQGGHFYAWSVRTMMAKRGRCLSDVASEQSTYTPEMMRAAKDENDELAKHPTAPF
jgi:hypothetical protein